MPPYRKSQGRQTFPFSAGTRSRPYRTSFGNPTVGRGKRIFSKAAVTGQAHSCMQACMNAFSNETNQPRFPDGRANESTGLRYMSNTEIEVTVGGFMEIIMFPGLNTCVAFKNATSKSLGAYTSLENSYNVKLQGVNNNVIGDVNFTGSNLTFDQNSNSYVAKWRGVSYGMFFQTVNNADENDGWWEAIRISPSQDVKDYGFTFAQATTEPQPLHIWHDFPDMGGDMVNQVSYSQGVIRDIQKVLFQLNHEVGERDFVDMNKKMAIGLGTGTNTLTPTAIPLDALKTNPGAQFLGLSIPDVANISSRLKDEAISQFFDQGFDCIYLRIHGADSSTGRSATRLTCTAAMNMEIMYDEKALNCRFHMPAVYHPLHEQIKGNSKAAEPNFLLGVGGYQRTK